MSLEQIQELIEKSNYKIVVSKTMTGCRVSLPNRKIPPKRKSHEITYHILPGYGVSVDGEAEYVKDIFWECPPYSIRTSIFLDILERAKMYDYDPILILYKGDDNEHVDNAYDSLPEHDNLHDMHTETLLLGIISNLNHNNSNKIKIELAKLAEESSVLPGYNFLVNKFFGGIQ